MTPAELKHIGQQLFGNRWKASLAKAIGRAPRTVHYWMSERHPIPGTAAALIRQLATQERKPQ